MASTKPSPSTIVRSNRSGKGFWTNDCYCRFSRTAWTSTADEYRSCAGKAALRARSCRTRSRGEAAHGNVHARSSLNGGKRLRPFLVVVSSGAFGVPLDAASLVGAVLERIDRHPGSMMICRRWTTATCAADGRIWTRRRTTRRPRSLLVMGLSTLAILRHRHVCDEIDEDANVRRSRTRALGVRSGIGRMVRRPYSRPWGRGVVR